MDWKQMHAFYAVVKLGSMTRAAESQFRTQSALSQQIAHLEENLGCKLLERIGKKGFVLTSAGEEFFRFAESLLLQEEDMQSRLKELAGERTGYIRLAAPYVPMYFLLPDVLRRYQGAYPGVQLHLMEKSPQESIELLKQGGIDFGIVHGSSVPQSLLASPWMEGHFMLAVPKGHELTRRETITLQDIARYPLNLSSRFYKFSARDKLDRKFEEAGLSYRIGVETSNASLNLHYTMLGHGISFLLCYDTLLRHYGDRLDFLGMDHLFPKETISLVERQHTYSPAFKKDFARFLLEAAPAPAAQAVPEGPGRRGK